MKPPWVRRTGLLLAAFGPLVSIPAQSTYAPPYLVTTFAGAAGVAGAADGTGTAATFHNPTGVAVDATGNVFVADNINNSIRKITPDGVVTIFAGSAVGAPGHLDGAGTAAFFSSPFGVATDGAGNVFVADQFSHMIRAITPGGVVTRLAGDQFGGSGQSDGPALTAAKFYFPMGVAVDGSGNVYVADSSNNTIRKIAFDGVNWNVTTLAGIALTSGHTDGSGGVATFNFPEGLAVDGSGYVYVADSNNHTIRKISPGGVVSTLAGLALNSGSTDGTGNAARFNHPTGVAVDAAGNVYVSEYLNYTLRKITPAGVVTTLAGTPAVSGSTNGFGSAAGFYHPFGLTVDVAGHLYVADTSNQLIRKGWPPQGQDFNGNGQSDLIWKNSTSGDFGFWLMNGTAFSSWVDVGILSPAWRIAASADFNGDGQADILWENTTTGDRGFWLMNGTTFSSWVDIGVVTTDWHIAAAADLNGDGKPDILWENTVTGDRGFWLMNGTAFSSWVDVGIISTSLRIVGAADFNGDSKADIVWENTATGKRVIWFMNGTTFVSSYNLGIVSTDWHIAAVADYNGDGKIDILWENTATGERGFWLMNGTTFISWQSMGVVGTDWRIAP